MDNFDRFRYLVMCLYSIMCNNRLHIQKNKRNITLVLLFLLSYHDACSRNGDKLYPIMPYHIILKFVLIFGILNTCSEISFQNI